MHVTKCSASCALVVAALYLALGTYVECGCFYAKTQRHAMLQPTPCASSAPSMHFASDKTWWYVDCIQEAWYDMLAFGAGPTCWW
jgi:hypothetical protein